MASPAQAESTPAAMRERLRTPSGFPGVSWLRFELCLLGIALFFYLLLHVLNVPANFLANLVVTFAIGNWSAVMVGLTEPWFVRRAFPWNWMIYLPVLALSGLAGSFFADVVTFILFHGAHGDLASRLGNNAGVGVLVTLVFGIISLTVSEQHEKLEARARELQGQVQLGHLQRLAQESELEQAHEIQMHLLPRETPQIGGFQIACAWQPAKAVSGDYFDVIPLGESRVALCIADVSGKGITAALLMANLQASVKAFATDAAGPASLCAKLNSVLAGSIAPGKFVTFFYGILHSGNRTFRYENAGHCLPLLVHADGSVDLPASYSGVLGVFSHWTFADREAELRSGDCMVLMTDGVLEAENDREEEFGYQRLIASVMSSRHGGAHYVRKRILDDVTDFCAGQFRDDASLIVVLVN